MRRPRILLYYATGLLVAWILKSFYSHAGAEELGWLLAPTCRLAGLLSGIGFERENGTGWISHTHRIIIGSTCSGMNFLIISFLTIFFTTVRRVGSPAARLLCLGVSLGASWALTITTNAIRILLAVQIYSMDIYAGFVTPARAHRLAGTAVYCLSLVIAYITIDRLFERFQHPGEARRSASVFVPLAWYLGVAVGLPLMNRAWRQDPGLFLEHSALVVAVCLLVALATIVTRVASRYRACMRKKPAGMLQSASDRANQ